MHRLLQRQLRKIERKYKEPSDRLEALKLIVSQSYEEADVERRKKDRSVELMSAELMELTRKNQAKSEAYIQAIMENVVDGVIMFCDGCQITSFNPGAERMFGFRVDEILDQCPSILFEPSYQEIFANVLETTKSTGGYMTTDRREEFLGRHKNKGVFPVEFSISTIHLEDEIFFIMIMKDISEQKQIEQELIDAKETAIAGAKAKTQFLSNMSHEIRTPMNAVMGLTEMLMEEEPRPDQLETLKILKFSGDNLLVIINDILDFSKIEAGKIDLEQIDLNLQELTSSIHSSLIGKAEDKGIFLEIEHGLDVPEFVKGDPVRLSQILTNLVSNAVKFTIEGGVKLRIGNVGETEAEISLHFEVIDTGIGIPEDKLALIFESFTQSNSNTTRKFGGTGLGLAISKKLVELFEGEIEVVSEEGRGTTFSFQLTFLKSQLKKEMKEAKKQKSSFSSMRELEGAKVLLVEDNKVNQIVAAKFLKKWNIIFDIAENGLMAVDMVQKSDYDLVLMDLHMPELDGYGATKRIRLFDDFKFQNLPIIALTASALKPIKKEVLDSGMNDFVSKPFNAKELYSAMMANIQQSKKNLEQYLQKTS